MKKNTLLLVANMLSSTSTIILILLTILMRNLNTSGELAKITSSEEFKQELYKSFEGTGITVDQVTELFNNGFINYLLIFLIFTVILYSIATILGWFAWFKNSRGLLLATIIVLTLAGFITALTFYIPIFYTVPYIIYIITLIKTKRTQNISGLNSQAIQEYNNITENNDNNGTIY